jgi:hypothetical protein
MTDGRGRWTVQRVEEYGRSAAPRLTKNGHKIFYNAPRQAQGGRSNRVEHGGLSLPSSAGRPGAKVRRRV